MRSRASNVESWEWQELWTILLKQFKRILAEQQQIELSETDINHIAEQATNQNSSDAMVKQVAEGMRNAVKESLDVLSQYNLTFEQSLAASMDELEWETTADFIELANIKTNAELRISAGSSLLLGLGDLNHVTDAWKAYRHGKNDPEDVDAVIARRALVFASGVKYDPDESAQWEESVLSWMSEVEGSS